MAYKIAIASSDGVNVDVHFGAAESFLIYSVDDDRNFSFEEKRSVPKDSDGANSGTGCDGNSQGQSGCGDGSGCHGNGGGCGGSGGSSGKVNVISDCRSIVAARIGFNVQKQLERKAISSFDVETTIQQALEKITEYFYKVDNHITLKKAGF